MPNDDTGRDRRFFDEPPFEDEPEEADAGPDRPFKAQQQNDELSEEERENWDASARAADNLFGFDVSELNGNFLFTVGVPGSGKSVLQWHLLRYLDQGKKYHFDLVPPATISTEHGARVVETYEHWQELWRRNRFPLRTPQLRPSIFRFKVGVLEKTWPDIDFGFFEVSGEDFGKFTRALSHDWLQLETLRQVLANKSCDFIIALVCIGSRAAEDDQLFSTFLRYLAQNFGDHYHRKSRVVLIISDPMSAAKLLAKRSGGSGTGPLDKRAFVETFLPATEGQLKRFKHDYALAQFDVGVIMRDAQGEYIETPSFIDAEIITDWMYEAFTGRNPNQVPMMKRLMKFFEEFS